MKESKNTLIIAGAILAAALLIRTAPQPGRFQTTNGPSILDTATGVVYSSSGALDLKKMAREKDKEQEKEEREAQ